MVWLAVMICGLVVGTGEKKCSFCFEESRTHVMMERVETRQKGKMSDFVVEQCPIKKAALPKEVQKK